MKTLYKFVTITRNIFFVPCAVIGALGVVYDVFGIKWFMKIINAIIPEVDYHTVWCFSYICLAIFIILHLVKKYIEKHKLSSDAKK